MSHRRYAPLLLAVLSSACTRQEVLFTQSAVESWHDELPTAEPGAPTLRIDAALEDGAVRGQLAWTSNCRRHRARSVEHRRSTTLVSDDAAGLGWLLAGGALAVGATVAFVASAEAPGAQRCVSGGGEFCDDQSGSLAALGGVATALSIGALGAAIATLTGSESGRTEERQDIVERETLGSQVACGTPAELEGIELVATASDGERRSVLTGEMGSFSLRVGDGSSAPAEVALSLGVFGPSLHGRVDRESVSLLLRRAEAPGARSSLAEPVTAAPPEASRECRDTERASRNPR